MKECGLKIPKYQSLYHHLYIGNFIGSSPQNFNITLESSEFESMYVCKSMNENNAGNVWLSAGVANDLKGLCHKNCE
jgi:hypothetical protein